MLYKIAPYFLESKKSAIVLVTMTTPELEDDKHWNDQFADSMDILEQLVAEAKLESRQGKTRSLTPDQL